MDPPNSSPPGVVIGGNCSTIGESQEDIAVTRSDDFDQARDTSSDEPSCDTASGVQTLPTQDPSRVGITRAAADLLTTLVQRYGPVIFHQSGGCCDGSSPMCYPDGPAVPVYISRPQFAAWRHTHLTIDAVPGRGAGFSLEAPEGLRFLTRSRLLTQAERDVEVS